MAILADPVPHLEGKELITSLLDEFLEINKAWE